MDNKTKGGDLINVIKLKGKNIMYKIEYSKGGKMGFIEANSPLEAITKDAKKSLPNTKVRFFETYPKIEPNHFIVTDIDNNSVTFYKMIILT